MRSSRVRRRWMCGWKVRFKPLTCQGVRQHSPRFSHGRKGRKCSSQSGGGKLGDSWERADSGLTWHSALNQTELDNCDPVEPVETHVVLVSDQV